MKKIEVTMEVTYRMATTFSVTDEEYQSVKDGALPDRVFDDIEGDIYYNPQDCNKEIDWAAVDDETGEVLQEWG